MALNRKCWHWAYRVKQFGTIFNVDLVVRVHAADARRQLDKLSALSVLRLVVKRFQGIEVFDEELLRVGFVEKVGRHLRDCGRGHAPSRPVRQEVLPP